MSEPPPATTLRGAIVAVAEAAGKSADVDGWIATVAKHVGAGSLRLATHVPKLTHPSVKATTLNLAPQDLPDTPYIGTRSLHEALVPDLVATSAAFLPGRLLAQLEHRGQPLHVLARQRDPELLAALSDDPEKAEALTEQLGCYGDSQHPLRAHQWLKGVFWRTGQDPKDDDGYELLVPLASSALSGHLYRTIQDAHFSEATEAARAAWKKAAPYHQGFRRFIDTATLMVGGSNRQNVSVGNAQQMGKHYLLDCRPPTWAQGVLRTPMTSRAFFGQYAFRKASRALIEALAELLLQDPKPNFHTRKRIRHLMSRVIESILMSALELRETLSPGWSQAEACKLPPHQRRWLDASPGEVADAGDDWQEAVADDHVNWLMDALAQAIRRQSRGQRDLPLGDDLRHEWRRECLEQLKWMEG